MPLIPKLETSRPHPGRTIGVWIAALLALTIPRCSGFKTFLAESAFPDPPVTVDGKTDDWLGRLSMLGDEPVSLGLLNDDDNLFVCLLVEDAALRGQIQMLGLTLWIDASGGKKKEFGINYPMGRVFGPKEAGQGTVRPRGEGRPTAGPPDFSDMPAGPIPADMKIIPSSKEEPRILPLEEVQGIELKVAPSSGMLVYELKIPLSRTEGHPWAVGTAPGKTIGLGFETGPFNTPRGGKPFGGMPGGGGPPMGGMPGGRPGMGGGGFDRGPELAQGLKIWATVRLASGIGLRKAGLLSANPSVSHDSP